MVLWEVPVSFCCFGGRQGNGRIFSKIFSLHLGQVHVRKEHLIHARSNGSLLKSKVPMSSLDEKYSS